MTLKKKTYSKPDFDAYFIDKEICLVMSSEDTGPDDPFGAAAPSPPPEQPSGLQANPFDENNLK